MTFCSNCGEKIGEGKKFCPSCGTPVTVEGAAAKTAGKGKLAAGKEKAGAAKDKVNEGIKGLAFRGMLERKVSPETRAKYPVLDKLIPLTNYIFCGLVLVVVVVIIAVAAGGGGGGRGTGVEADPFRIKADAWASGNITAASSGGVWYSFDVKRGTEYHVFWGDTDNSGGTADVKVAAYDGGGKELFDSDSNSRSFTASANGAIKVKVYPYSRSETGTFTVAFGTSSAKPPATAVQATGSSGSSRSSGGGRTDRALNGTWVETDNDFLEMVFNNGTYTMNAGTYQIRGTYTTSGGVMTVTVNEMLLPPEIAAMFGSSTGWISADQLRALGMDTSEFATDGSYSVRGNTLDLDGRILTKKR